MTSRQAVVRLLRHLLVMLTDDEDLADDESPRWVDGRFRGRRAR